MDRLTREELKDRIGKKNFDPADVEVVGGMDTRPPAFNAAGMAGLPADMYELVVEDFKQARAAWEARNEELFGRKFPGSSCEHCGARIRWAAIVKYIPTGQHFITGEICAEERMELTNRSDHDIRLARMSAEHRAQQVRIANAKANFFRTHPAEAAFLYDTDRPYSGFLADLTDKLERYGDLSDKQVACITRDIDRLKATEARKVAEAIVLQDAPDIQPGRYAVTGEVVHDKWTEDFGYGSTHKMMVKAADGNKFWVSVPKALEDRLTAEVNAFAYGKSDTKPREIRGLKLTVTAAWEVSPDDSHFAFGKRPSLKGVDD